MTSWRGVKFTHLKSIIAAAGLSRFASSCLVATLPFSGSNHISDSYLCKDNSPSQRQAVSAAPTKRAGPSSSSKPFQPARTELIPCCLTDAGIFSSKCGGPSPLSRRPRGGYREYRAFSPWVITFNQGAWFLPEKPVKSLKRIALPISPRNRDGRGSGPADLENNPPTTPGTREEILPSPSENLI